LRPSATPPAAPAPLRNILSAAPIAAMGLPLVVDRVFPLGEAAAAHRHLKSGRAIGKVVLTV